MTEMKQHGSGFQLILSSLLSAVLGLPLESLVNEGPQLGPLTPAHGDLVQTPRGLSSISLEGFSEDLNEDGYVDPVAQAVVAPVAVAAAAAVYTTQYAHHLHQPAVAYATHQPAVAYAAAPNYAVPQQVAAYAAAAPQVVAQPPVTYTVPHHQVGHHQVAYTGHHLADAVQLRAAPAAVAVAGHHHGLCHNHLGSAVPCAL